MHSQKAATIVYATQIACISANGATHCQSMVFPSQKVLMNEIFTYFIKTTIRLYPTSKLDKLCKANTLSLHSPITKMLRCCHYSQASFQNSIDLTRPARCLV